MILSRLRRQHLRIAQEEEQAVLDDGTADRAALIVLYENGPLDPVGVVEPVVPIERGILVLPKSLAVETVRALLRYNLDLHRSLPGAVGAQVRRRHRHLLNRFQTIRHEREEACATALEPLRV